MNIKNPYISVEISENQFIDLKSIIKKELESLGIKDVKSMINPHISIAYILGENKKQDLELFAEEIANDGFKMTVNGIKILNSSFYQGSVLALALDHSDDFLYSQEHVKECLCNNEIMIKEDFPGGFQAHISLFLLPELDPETLDLLPLYLETAISNIKKEIKGEIFSIHNENREKIIEKRFN